MFSENPAARALVEATPQALIITDQRGAILLVNDRAEALFDYHHGELLEHSIALLVPELLPQGGDTLLPLPMGTTLRLLAKHRDGSTFQVEVRLCPIGANAGCIACYIDDVTNRMRREHAQALLEEASSTLASSLDYDVTLEHVAHLAVPAFADWCVVELLETDGSVHFAAWACANPKGESVARALKHHCPSDVQGTGSFADVLYKGEPCLVSEFSDALLHRLSGDTAHLALLDAIRPASFMLVPLTVGARVLGALFLARTRDHRYDLDDLHLAEKLARLAARALDNACSYAAAQQAVQERDLFLASAVHELRNALSGVLSIPNLLQRKLEHAGGLTPAMERVLHLGDRQARSLHSLTAKLLDLTRLRYEQLALEQHQLELGALVQEVITQFEPTRERKTIIVQATGEPLDVDADEVRVEQVLRNLLGNALKHSPENGEVVVRLERRGAHAWVHISDQGAGLPAAELSQLFQPFHRTKSARQQEIGGTGLGLFIVKQIVTAHGGDVTVQSTEGSGSTFSFSLPLRSPTNDAQTDTIALSESGEKGME